MRVRMTPVAVALLVATCVAPQARAGEGGVAMRMYRDPGSGALGAPPAQTEPAARALVAESAPRAVIEEPVNAPAGGVKVAVPSRLRAAVTRHAAGSGAHECGQVNGSARE